MLATARDEEDGEGDSDEEWKGIRARTAARQAIKTRPAAAQVRRRPLPPHPHPTPHRHAPPARPALPSLPFPPGCWLGSRVGALDSAAAAIKEPPLRPPARPLPAQARAPPPADDDEAVTRGKAADTPEAEAQVRSRGRAPGGSPPPWR